MKAVQELLVARGPLGGLAVGLALVGEAEQVVSGNAENLGPFRATLTRPARSERGWLWGLRNRVSTRNPLLLAAESAYKNGSPEVFRRLLNRNKGGAKPS